jgi:hypothetical protein
MVTAIRARGQVMDRTLRVEEHELKLAVAQFLRSRGFHATPELVLFKWGGGGHATEGETVAEVAVKVGGPSGEADPPEPARVSQ